MVRLELVCDVHELGCYSDAKTPGPSATSTGEHLTIRFAALEHQAVLRGWRVYENGTHVCPACVARA